MTTTMREEQAFGVMCELGDWVESRTERCRSGRRVHTMVNHRRGVAVEFGDDELDSEGRPTPGLRDELVEEGFLAEAASEPSTASSLSSPSKLLQFVRTFDVSVSNADRFVHTLYRRARLEHAFSPVAVAAQVVLGLTGVVAAFVVLRGSSPNLHAETAAVPVYLLLGGVAVAVHELAHAVVVAHYGRRIDRFGFCLHLATPTFYVESVDALLLTRRQRIIQAAAGPWAEWLVTSVAAIAVWTFPASNGLAPILYRFLAINVINVVTNLLPFVGLDGSLLLADGIGTPDLSRRSHGAVGRLALRIAGHQPAPREEVALGAYSIANALVAVGLVALSAWLWYEMFAELITTLYRHGPAGWLVLTIAGVLLARPALTPLIPRMRQATTTLARLHHDLGFRRSMPWRTAAAHQLRRLDRHVAALTAEQMGLLAGLLQLVPAHHHPDPNSWLIAAVGPDQGLRRPIRVAVHRDHIRRLAPVAS